MPRTILPRRNRCALSATGMQKPVEEKDARGVTCFMEELNDRVDPFTACADKCTKNVREWQ